MLGLGLGLERVRVRVKVRVRVRVSFGAIGLVSVRESGLRLGSRFPACMTLLLATESTSTCKYKYA